MFWIPESAGAEVRKKRDDTRPDPFRAWLSSVDLTEMMKQDQGT
ncbi:hypothetical protein PM8797T_23579 [Gimesia maris DSM 8797]|nr:hypothetical protein PM8797T_23579 [Gimesia maris DSM 8797]